MNARSRSASDSTRPLPSVDTTARCSRPPQPGHDSTSISNTRRIRSALRQPRLTRVGTCPGMVSSAVAAASGAGERGTTSRHPDASGANTPWYSTRFTRARGISTARRDARNAIGGKATWVVPSAQACGVERLRLPWVCGADARQPAPDARCTDTNVQDDPDARRARGRPRGGRIPLSAPGRAAAWTCQMEPRVLSRADAAGGARCRTRRGPADAAAHPANNGVASTNGSAAVLASPSRP